MRRRRGGRRRAEVRDAAEAARLKREGELERARRRLRHPRLQRRSRSIQEGERK
jgi:hypothetical protein